MIFRTVQETAPFGHGSVTRTSFQLSAEPPVDRIEQSVTLGMGRGIVQENATAATALFTFVRMPLFQHGSRGAIEHWRGSRSSPLGQNPQLANLGGRAQKG